MEDDNEDTFLDLSVENDEETNELVLVDRMFMKELIRLDRTSDNRVLMKWFSNVLNDVAESSFSRGFESGHRLGANRV